MLTQAVPETGVWKTSPFGRSAQQLLAAFGASEGEQGDGGGGGPAIQLTDVALTASRRAGNREMQRDLRKRKTELIRLHADFKKIKLALEELDENPADPAANLSAGRYY